MIIDQVTLPLRGGHFTVFVARPVPRAQREGSNLLLTDYSFKLFEYAGISFQDFGEDCFARKYRSLAITCGSLHTAFRLAQTCDLGYLLGGPLGEQCE
jgi:hypothetical protein